MTYPYRGRDLFKEPESYSYSECESQSYIEDWRCSRKNAANLILKHKHYPKKDQNGRRFLPPGAISLCSILNREYVSPEILSPFIIKYEVFGRLFAWYTASGKRHVESPLADLGTYILFAEHLCAAAETTGGLKFVSTLLKLCDALASQRASDFGSQNSMRLIAVFEKEAILVDKVSKDR